MNKLKHVLILTLIIFLWNNNPGSSQNSQFGINKTLIVGKWNLVKSIDNGVETNLSVCDKKNYLEFKDAQDSQVLKITYRIHRKSCSKEIENGCYELNKNEISSGLLGRLDILTLNDTILTVKSSWQTRTYRKIK